ncbi:MAG: hypothetical protein ABI053_03140 [Lacisediminihabitans sp.]
MKRFALLTTVFTAVLTLVLPFIGGSGPALLGNGSSSAQAGNSSAPLFASPVVATSEGTASVASSNIAAFASRVPSSIAQNAASIKAAASAPVATTVDTEHLAQKPVPKPAPPVVEAASGPSRSGPSRSGSSRTSGSSPVTTTQRRAAAAASGGGCPGNVGGGVNGNADLASFAAAYNAIRVANCLQPVPMSHFRYDSCMEQRLTWMGNDPDSNPGNTWGHMGVRSINPNPATGQYYSVTSPSVGCDGNLAGGTGNSGATVAQKWWDSLSHRASLYRPSFTGNTAGVCINFAMTHGGNGDAYSFTRAAARWVGC